jgi:hypothetical protein
MPDLYYTTQEKADSYDNLAPVFRSVYEEIQELCKKKPEATLNKTKVALINRIFVDVKDFLNGMPVTKYLELLEDDNLPQYSDVVLVLAQYAAGLNQFRSRHYGYFLHEDQWVIKSKEKEQPGKS